MSKDSPRTTYQEAIEFLQLPSNMIRHLLVNDNGTYSIMSHLVCEYCDYCDTQGDCTGVLAPLAVPYKEDPYENEGKGEQQ